MARENGDILAGPDVPKVNLQAPPRVALLEQTLTMPAAQVTKEIYVAAALSTDKAELDVLAGAVVELADALALNTTAAELRSAIGELSMVVTPGSMEPIVLDRPHASARSRGSSGGSLEGEPSAFPISVNDRVARVVLPEGIRLAALHVSVPTC